TCACPGSRPAGRRFSGRPAVDMDASFRSGLTLLIGIALLATPLAVHLILLETAVPTVLLAAAGAVLTAIGLIRLRTELAALLRRRRAEIALGTLGVVGVLIAVAYFSVRWPFRFDLT